MTRRPRRSNEGAATASPSETLAGYAALAIFAAGSIALLDHRSMWLDEFYSVHFSLPHAPFLRVLTERIATDRSPPLFYTLVHYWTALFGDGAVALRSLNLVGVGVLGIAMTYSRSLAWVGRAWLPFWILLLTSRFAWDYVTEGRAYFLAFSAATLLDFFFVELLRRMDAGEGLEPRLILSTGLTAFVLSMLHYYGVLAGGGAILVLFVAALFKRLRQPAIAFLAIGALILTSEVLWIVYSVPRIPDPPGGKYWLGFAPVKAVTDFLFFTLSDNPIVVSLAVFAGYGLRRRLIEDLPLWGLALVGLITYGVAFVISLKQPILLARHLIVLAPALLLILARVLSKAPQRWVVPAVLASAVAISLPIAVWKSLPPREDWRSAARYLDTHFAQRCERAVMIATPSSRDYAVLRLQARGRDWTFLPIAQSSVAPALASPCPIVAWAGHMNPEEFSAAFGALDWGGARIEIIHFWMVHLAVRR